MQRICGHEGTHYHHAIPSIGQVKDEEEQMTERARKPVKNANNVTTFPSQPLESNGTWYMSYAERLPVKSSSLHSHTLQTKELRARVRHRKSDRIYFYSANRCLQNRGPAEILTYNISSFHMAR